MFNEIAYLCKEIITQDKYLNETTSLQEREVFVRAKSIGSREFYRAATTDYHPALTLVLADYYDYDGESVVRYDGKLYDVIRTFRSGNRLELILQERIGRRE